MQRKIIIHPMNALFFTAHDTQSFFKKGGNPALFTFTFNINSYTYERKNY